MIIERGIERQLLRGPRTSAELAAFLGVSPSTINRAIQNLPSAVQIGRARASQYGLAESIRGLPAAPHPVFRIGAAGDVLHIGNLTAIVSGNFWYENLEEPTRSRGYDGLPWFIQDLRPQGFLGRATVRHFAERGWPSDLQLWSDRDVLASILHSAAHEHIGNLLIGNTARAAYENSRHPLYMLPSEQEPRIARYQAMVEQMGDGAVAGTSVNGEQPKFCAGVVIPDSNQSRHVLVKFSAPLNTEAGQRWSDLLVLEERCLNSIREDLGIPAAVAAYLTCGTRAYLEVDRFDRTPNGGRRGVISFSALDGELTEGHGSGWPRVAHDLVLGEHLHADAPAVIDALEYFAVLVGNSDRHLGNLSVHFDGTRPMTLTPIYDFLPMCYAPTSMEMNSAPLSAASFPDLQRITLAPQMRERVEHAARRFWDGSSQDQRLSPAMRILCARNMAALIEAMEARERV